MSFEQMLEQLMKYLKHHDFCKKILFQELYKKIKSFNLFLFLGGLDCLDKNASQYVFRKSARFFLVTYFQAISERLSLARITVHCCRCLEDFKPWISCSVMELIMLAQISIISVGDSTELFPIQSRYQTLIDILFLNYDPIGFSIRVFKLIQ